MVLTTFLLCVFSLALISYGQQVALEKHIPSDPIDTCNQLKAAKFPVYFPPSWKYLSDISHSSRSSTEVSACSVEPNSTKQLGEILRILGSTRTPFAVKSGGHATNPTFSSTKGVQIAMSSFNRTDIYLSFEVVDVGSGVTWDQVYKELEPTGMNVVGGRIPGVGVAGLTLGGGYSFMSNEYGLSLDNVLGYELVLPNGTAINVTPRAKDLWFGLRGGMNNFGIVTKFVLKLRPQNKIWGGSRVYAEDQLDSMKNALVKFQQKDDPKAAFVLVLTYSSGQFSFSAQFFYDAPTPSEVFNDLLAIPFNKSDLSTRSLFDLVQSLGSQSPDHFRYFYEGAPVTQYSPVVFDQFVNQTKFWGARLLAFDKSVSLSSVLEPFDKDVFSHGSASAHPPDRSHALFPSNLAIQWSNSSLDEVMASALRNFSSTIHYTALRDGQNVTNAAVYVNYAISGTLLKDMYGENVERLRTIKRAIDPDDVMGLAGGWKF